MTFHFPSEYIVYNVRPKTEEMLTYPKPDPYLRLVIFINFEQNNGLITSASEIYTLDHIYTIHCFNSVKCETYVKSHRFHIFVISQFAFYMEVIVLIVS